MTSGMIRFFFSIMVFFTLMGKAYAADDIYTVTNIKVDEQGIDANEAKRNALAEAQQIGVYKLLRRFTSVSQHALLPSLSAAEVARMVKGMEIASEKISSGRYQAVFSVSYYPEYIRRVLEESKLNFTENTTPKMLLIPIYHHNGKTALWANNPWKQAWNESQLSEGLLKIYLPLGDLEDLSLVNEEDVLVADYAKLMPLAQKYGAHEILIAEAVYKSSPDSDEVTLNVILQHLSKKGTESTVASFTGTSEDYYENFLRASANDIIKRMESGWKYNNQAQEAAISHANVIVPLHSAKEWSILHKRLQQADFIEEIDIKELSSRGANIDIHYRGGFQQFPALLQEEGFLLEKNRDLLLLKSLKASNVKKR